MTEGRDFGRKTDNQGCVDESISRYKKEPGFTSTISNAIFMRACLDSSRPTRGFCDDVPRQMEFIKSAQWRVSQCARVPRRPGKRQQLPEPLQSGAAVLRSEDAERQLAADER
ncbi:MAG: hypothetical protein DMF74_13590 [Acidobacteria bacterium]|nr:MAG: hypothetical protein DMF74_13590 [Acidobacteriota bacterium]